VTAEFVEWVDSRSQDGPWVSPDELDGEAVTCFSVGYVAFAGDDALTLSMSYHADEKGDVAEWGHPLSIPKCAIVRRFRVPVV
jgi:hypothetical protein